jgi:hypothetical protein
MPKLSPKNSTNIQNRQKKIHNFLKTKLQVGITKYQSVIGRLLHNWKPIIGSSFLNLINEYFGYGYGYRF